MARTSDAIGTVRARSGRLRLAALLAGVAVVATGCITFQVQKRVTNGTSTGPFVVHISCDDGSGPPEERDLTFNALNSSGEQTLTPFPFDANEAGTTTCTITETDDAGATSVAMECLPPVDADVTCSAPGPTLTVTSTDPGIRQVIVTLRVTNDFTTTTTATTTTTTTTTAPTTTTAAPPPAAVVVAPRFTG